MRPTGILILPAIKMEPTSGNAPDCSVYKTEVARFAYRQNGPYGTSCTLTGPRSKRGASAIGLRRDGVAGEARTLILRFWRPWLWH